MHKEILSPEQLDLLPLVKQFNPEFYLAGGTAVALYLGHRRHRAQLSYFEDIDYSEPVEYLIPAVSADEIKKMLIDKATDMVI